MMDLSTKAVNCLLLGFLLTLTPVVLLRQVEAKTIPVLLVAKGEQKLYRLDLEEYLIGVVAAEMPARFEIEALKAQSVAARTVAVGRMRRFGGRGTRYHAEADFSDDPNESQAWLGQSSLRKKWGAINFLPYYKRVKQAVEDTEGIIMEYNGQPIDAVFHSTCGIGTEAAGNVWNHDLDYLKAVSCGMDKHSPKYEQKVFFSWDEASKLLGITEREVRLVRITKYTSGDRVSQLKFGNRHMSGGDFRNKLGLNSSAFEIDKQRNGIQVSVSGYGHGVGMCQYGADGYAREKGWNFKRILSHYYKGVKFTRIKY